MYLLLECKLQEGRATPILFAVSLVLTHCLVYSRHSVNSGMSCVSILLRNGKLHRSHCFQRTKDILLTMLL